MVQSTMMYSEGSFDLSRYANIALTKLVSSDMITHARTSRRGLRNLMVLVAALSMCFSAVSGMRDTATNAQPMPSRGQPDSASRSEHTTPGAPSDSEGTFILKHDSLEDETPKIPSWMRENAPKEQFRAPLRDGLLPNTETKADTPWTRTIELVLGAGLVGGGAFLGAEYGIKNIAMGNTEITEALGMSVADGDKAPQDLHDVMFRKIGDLEGIEMSEGVNYGALNGYVYLYLLTGAFLLGLGLFCILNASGVKWNYAAPVIVFVVIGGLISSAGFCQNMTETREAFVWSDNSTIWIGVAVVGLATLLAIFASMWACYKSRQLAPKGNDL